MRVIVIGGGIIGLTTSVKLQRAGYQVSLVAERFTPQTNSDVAAAVWYPFLVEPEEKVLEWGKIAYDYFREESELLESGVIWQRGVEFLYPDTLMVEATPSWYALVDTFMRIPAEELPLEYALGYRFAAPVVDMSQYLGYLTTQFEQAGGKMYQKKITNLDEVFAEVSIVVNCSGLGARDLVGDQEVYPVRGQVVRLPNPGQLPTISLHGGSLDLTYIISRNNDVVLGGIAESGVEDTTVKAEQTADILQRCIQLVPSLVDLPILSVAVGLRPARRSGVRLEFERLSSDRLLIHNYGHGGAGVTLCWGCADEIVRDLPLFIDPRA